MGYKRHHESDRADREVRFSFQLWDINIDTAAFRYVAGYGFSFQLWDINMVDVSILRGLNIVLAFNYGI